MLVLSSVHEAWKNDFVRETLMFYRKEKVLLTSAVESCCNFRI